MLPGRSMLRLFLALSLRGGGRCAWSSGGVGSRRHRYLRSVWEGIVSMRSMSSQLHHIHGVALPAERLQKPFAGGIGRHAVSGIRAQVLYIHDFLLRYDLDRSFDLQMLLVFPLSLQCLHIRQACLLISILLPESDRRVCCMCRSKDE